MRHKTPIKIEHPNVANEPLMPSLNGPEEAISVQNFDIPSAAEFIKKVLSINAANPKIPITIHITSYGGNVDGLVAMLDVLDAVSNPIITVVLGTAMSAGAVLLSHGDYRFCTPNARIMIHEISSGTYGNINEISNDLEESKRLNTQIMHILAENCGIKGGYSKLKGLLKQRTSYDWFLDAEEALKLGIIDVIGFPCINQHIAYEITWTKPNPDKSENEIPLKKPTKRKSK